MADRREDGTVYSLFRAAAIATPIGIGGWMAYKNLRGNIKPMISEIQGTSPQNLSFATARESIRNMAESIAPGVASPIVRKWQLEQLVGMKTTTSLTSNQLYDAWMKAAKYVDPTGEAASTIGRQLKSAATPQQFLDDAVGLLSRSSSIHMQRVASTFLEDIGVLQGRAKAGLSLEMRDLPKVARLHSQHIGNLSKLEKSIRDPIFKMKEMLKSKVRVDLLTRPDLPGASELKVSFFGGEFGHNFSLTVPQTLPGKPGTIVSNLSKPSEYITGLYGTVESGQLKGIYTHPEWTLHRAASELVPQMMTEKRLDDRMIRSYVNQFNQNMIKTGTFIPALPSGLNRAIDETAAIKSDVLRLYQHGKGGYGPKGFDYPIVTREEAMDILKSGGVRRPGGDILPLFPGSSANQIARGVFSLRDIRPMVSRVPSSVSYGRLPLKWLRPEYNPTQAALEAMGAEGPQKWGWAMTQGGVSAPMLRTMYISPQYGTILAKHGITESGQATITEKAAQLMGSTELRSFEISKMSPELEELLKANKLNENTWMLNQQLSAGTLLGDDPQGRPVTVPPRTTLEMARLGQVEGKEPILEIFGREDLSGVKSFKGLGIHKGMVAETKSHKHLARTLGVSYMGEADFATVTSELRKSRWLHQNQMFTSLWQFTRANISSGKQVSQIASNFANDPIKVISGIAANAEQANKFSHEAALVDIFKLARGAKLTPRQMGSVFGAVPDVFGMPLDDPRALQESWIQTMLTGTGKKSWRQAARTLALTSEEAGYISRGVAEGMGQLFFGGRGGPGAGGLATIEPRMFEFLNAPQLGALGPEIQKDIAYRMMASHPERVLEEKALAYSKRTFAEATSRTLAEINRGLASIPGAVSAEQLLQNIPEGAKLPLEPSILKVPSIGDVSIPSESALSQLAGYKIGEDKVVYPELAKGYRDIIENAFLYENNQISQEAMKQQMLDFVPKIARSQALSVMGVGGILRDRVPGSMYLTGMVPTSADILGSLPRGTVGISEETATRLMETMEQVYGKEQMARQRRAFFQGEILPAILGRHPYIGPYSSQITGAKIIPGMENDKIYIPEDPRDLTANIGGKAGQPTIIKMSQLTGLAGDVDSDVNSLILAGPQLSPKLEGYLADPANRLAYEQYAIRQQVLKARTAQESGLTLTDLMAGEAEKLGITKRPGELGKVSLPIQRARAALLSGAGGLSAQETMNALAVNELMEQLPLSSKHISAAEAMDVGGLFREVSTAYERQRPGEIQSVFEKMLARSPETQAAIRGGFEAEITAPGYAPQKMFIPGADIEKAAEHTARSMRAFESMGGTGINPIRERELLWGRVEPTLAEASKMTSPESLRNTPFGAFFTPGVAASPAAEATSRTMAMIKRAMASGRSAIAHAKPLIIGSAIGIGIATLLSSPPLSVDPQSTVPPRPNMRSGSGGANLSVDMAIPERTPGAPTSADLTRAANTARVSAPGGLARQVRVYGTSGSGTDYGSLSQQMQQSLGGRANIHSSINDRKSSLTPQRLSDILNNR